MAWELAMAATAVAQAHRKALSLSETMGAPKGALQAAIERLEMGRYQSTGPVLPPGRKDV